MLFVLTSVITENLLIYILSLAGYSVFLYFYFCSVLLKKIFDNLLSLIFSRKWSSEKR